MRRLTQHPPSSIPHHTFLSLFCLETNRKAGKFENNNFDNIMKMPYNLIQLVAGHFYNSKITGQFHIIQHMYIDNTPAPLQQPPQHQLRQVGALS